MLGLSSGADVHGRTRRMKRIAAICAATMIVAGCSSKTGPGNGAGNTTGGGNTVGTGNPKKPPQPGPDQKVLLIWQPVTKDWMVQLPGDPPTKPDKAHTHLKQGVGPTKFVVEVVGNSSATFKDPGGLSAWEGDNAKSQVQSGIHSTQILGPILTDGGKHLIFYDLNADDPVTINYQIDFNNGVKAVDPIIDNGGGVSE